MSKNKTVIGEINVEVKAGLSVDRKTADICMDLLAIYFGNLGHKGVVLDFPKGDMRECAVRELETDEEVMFAMRAPLGEKEVRKRNNYA